MRDNSWMFCVVSSLPAVDVEVLIVPWFEGEGPAAFGPLDRAAPLENICPRAGLHGIPRSAV